MLLQVLVLMISLVSVAAALWILAKINHQQSQARADLQQLIMDSRLQQQREFSEFKNDLKNELQQQQIQTQRNQLDTLKILQESLQKTVSLNFEMLGKQVQELTAQVNQQLKEISGQVEKRLNEGFEKTTATFTDIVKRLALIDEAQKKITELSTHVVSLQEVLADKRSRGAFGEVQLQALVSNIMPEQHYSMQWTLKNGKRADCILFLPEPSGHIVIDAKFPLDNYRKMMDIHLNEPDRLAAKKQFKQDIRTHIQDIAEKYICAGETAEGAIMFIPAEAVFAEIHGHYPELIEIAHRARVWLVSPTTLMAVLTTANTVLKDAATRKQVHLIQEHLIALSKDFSRFKTRMDKLADHIDMANRDVKEVKISADKISNKFNQIERVELLQEIQDVEQLEEQQ